MKAGLDPRAAVDLLEDFERFENPWPLLRTHPYIAQRREDLRRYLSEIGAADKANASSTPTARAQADDRRLRNLRQTDRLYPPGSVSWNNLQRQIDAIES